MNSQHKQQNQLNQSKFLSEHINLEEQPTEEEIIEKAQQLQIDDLGLAKQSLVKQLDDQWKPYINRDGEVFYINLQEQKAFTDHPIDMQIKITYAIKNKKKIPSFRQYTINQVSQNPILIHEEIRKYQLSHKLNVVYEESQEQSIRRQTKLSEESEADIDYDNIDDQVLQETKKYQRQLNLIMQKQLMNYKKTKQVQYKNREESYKQYIKQKKKKRLQELSEEIQKQWILKNQLNFHKSIENIREQFQGKKAKLQALYDQQQKLLNKMYGWSEIGIDIRTFHEQKALNTKMTLLNKLQNDLNLQFRNKIATHFNQAVQLFNNQNLQYINTKINYKQTLQKGFQHLIKNQKLKIQEKPKRKHSIFGLDLTKPQEKVQQRKKIQYNVNETVWCNKDSMINLQIRKYEQISKRSLPLRLMKRIL